jgi:hypothetical protein
MPSTRSSEAHAASPDSQYDQAHHVTGSKTPTDGEYSLSDPSALVDLKEKADHVEVLEHDGELDPIQVEINALVNLSEEEFALEQKRLLRKVSTTWPS